MTSELTFQKLARILDKAFDDEANFLRPETSAVDIPDWDSGNQIGLVVSIEAESRVRFTLGEIAP